MRISERTIFKEEQQFRENWLWAIIIVAGLSIIVIMFISGLSTNAFSEKSFLLGFVGLIVIETILFTLFYITKFETQVTEKAILYRWSPYLRNFKKISKEEIEKAELKKGPSFERGFKLVPGYGKAHVVNAGKGIQLVLKSSKKIFIGTAEPFLFKRAIDNMMADEYKKLNL